MGLSRGLVKELKVNKLGPNKFAFIFPSIKEKNKVLSRGPWSIKDYHQILKEIPVDISPREIDLSST